MQYKFYFQLHFVKLKQMNLDFLNKFNKCINKSYFVYGRETGMKLEITLFKFMKLSNKSIS